MTWKLVTPTWNPWALAGHVVMVISLGMLSLWMVGPVIIPWLMVAVAILIKDWLSVGSKKSLQHQQTKSCTTLPTTPGGFTPVDSPSMVGSLIRCSPHLSSMKTVSHTASMRLASTTSKKLNRKWGLSKRLRTSVCIPKKNSGNSLRCMLANTPRATPDSLSSYGIRLSPCSEKKNLNPSSN